MLQKYFSALNVKQFAALSTTPNISHKTKPKTAVVMLNMGGPPGKEYVHDFLLRLFSDKEIIDLPAQSYLSRFIAKRRSPKIIKQYDQIGGGSPIKEWTTKQGNWMINHLDSISPETAPHKLYIGFRYVHPLTETTINQVESDDVERVVAFSQYPQFSCATAGSSFNAIARHYASVRGTFTGVETIEPPSVCNGSQMAIWSFIDRWPLFPPLITAFADHIKQKMMSISDPKERQQTVLLFSAHSIPLSVVNRGDPYPAEVAATVHAVMKLLRFQWPFRLVWQSKVGPAAWLGPSTQDTLHGLARLGYHHAMLIPIAFTSDHIETLYEMDVEYCTEVAKKAGMTRVHRAAALNDNAVFMKGLAELVAKHLRRGEPCSRQYFLRCPMCTNSHCASTRQFLKQDESRLVKWTRSHFPLTGNAETRTTHGLLV
ncbi:Ferrochelatase mitochondrial [Fasciola hepatica]|uniref:Ferrochelatase n=1 Tax=Fasciola hepatica TaxID=6192 RepID=A0A4E0QUF7_FASHE|nr:Ferrochelatase mitochondrial [Fasciola hepatica]